MQTVETRPMIHRATAADTDAALAVWEHVRRAGAFADELPDDPAELEALLSTQAVVVMCALRQGEPLGIAFLQRDEQSRVHVRFVGVVPTAHAQGVGTALLTNALFAVLPASALYMLLPGDEDEVMAWAVRRGFRILAPDDRFGAAHMVQLELRLDAPAHGCGCGEDAGCSCAGPGCGH